MQKEIKHLISPINNSKMPELVAATTLLHYETIEKLARVIIPEVYAPWLPHDHCHFFVDKYQTAAKIQQQVADGYEYFLLLDHLQKTAGYLGILVKDDVLLISKLYILKEYRSQQMGQYAMDQALQKALDNGVQKAELIVNRQNERAIRFYQRNGFAITENLVHQFENGQTVKDYKMTKNYQF